MLAFLWCQGNRGYSPWWPLLEACWSWRGGLDHPGGQCWSLTSLLWWRVTSGVGAAVRGLVPDSVCLAQTVVSRDFPLVDLAVAMDVCRLPRCVSPVRGS